MHLVGPTCKGARLTANIFIHLSFWSWSTFLTLGPSYTYETQQRSQQRYKMAKQWSVMQAHATCVLWPCYKQDINFEFISKLYGVLQGSHTDGFMTRCDQRSVQNLTSAE